MPSIILVNLDLEKPYPNICLISASDILTAKFSRILSLKRQILSGSCHISFLIFNKLFAFSPILYFYGYLVNHLIH